MLRKLFVWISAALAMFLGICWFWKPGLLNFSLRGLINLLLGYDTDFLSWQPLIPLYGLLAAAIILLGLLPRTSSWVRGGVALAMVYLAGRYLLWRILYTLNFENSVNTAVTVLFVVMEAILLIYTVCSIFVFQVRLTDRRPMADLNQRTADETSYFPTVDIFVASYNEPANLLRRTLSGCLNLNYANKQIYLLDDSRRPHIRALCEELGVNYLDRPDNKHYKAGNLNNALGKTNGELIIFLDADFIPYRHFIQRVRGFFLQPDVALVQTPQHFHNFDAVSHNLGLTGHLTNEQDIFFRNGQPSRDAAGAVICHGTCFMARRAHLEAIGGIPTETLSEDFLTSLKLQIEGKQVLYLNEVLSAGFVPDNVGDYLTQRARWGRGTIQVLFSSLNPLTASSLTDLQKAYHLMGFWYWISFIAVVCIFTMPLGYLFFGLQPLRASMEGILYFMIPLFAGSIIFTNWINNGRRSFFWSTIYDLIIAWPVAITVAQSLVQPFGTPFKVTPKGATSDKASLNTPVALPLMVLLGLYVIGILYNMFIRSASAESSPSENVIMFWCLYNGLMLWIAIIACVDAPQRRETIRFTFPPGKKSLTLRYADATLKGSLADMSETGLRAIFESTELAGLKQLETGVCLQLQLPAVGMLEAELLQLDVSPDNKDKAVARFRLVNVELVQYKRIVDFLFCEPPVEDAGVVRNEYQYFSDFFKAILRIYPLTHHQNPHLSKNLRKAKV